MKLISAALLFFSMSLSGAEVELGFYSVDDERKETLKLLFFEYEKTADRVIWTNKKKEFDIGLGPAKDNMRSPIKFSFEEIRVFLENEKHKDLAIVWFDKSVMWNEWEFVTERVSEVVQQMQGVGYKRVIIFGAHSSGVHYLADTALGEKEEAE